MPRRRSAAGPPPVRDVGALGMRAFSGVTIGVAGNIIGIRWLLALSALALLAMIFVLLAFTMKARS